MTLARSKHLAAVSLAAACLAWSPYVQAQPEEEGTGEEEEGLDPKARQHLEVGLKLYEVGRYQDAIDEFKAGYAIDPAVDLLFAWAQAARLAGDCEEALVQYKRVLEVASERQAEVVGGFVKECEDKVEKEHQELIAREQARQAEEERERAAREAAAQAEAEEEAKKKDRPKVNPVGPVLMGAGGAVIGLGIGLVAVAQVRASAVESASNYQDFSDQFERAQRSVPGLRVGGSIAIVAGAGLVATGLVLHLKKKKKAKESGATVGAWAGPQGGGAWLRARF